MFSKNRITGISCDKLWTLLVVSTFFIPAQCLDARDDFVIHWTDFDKTIPTEPAYNLTFFGDTTCQVPDGNVHSDRVCNFRNRFFRENAFGWWSGYGCYFYTQPALVNSSAEPLRIFTCQYRGEDVVCMAMATPGGPTGCYPFDSRFPEVVAALSLQFSSAVGLSRWLRCETAAKECCQEYSENSIEEDAEVCPATWDAWACWSSTMAESVKTKVCPEFAYSNAGPSCNHYGSKTCFSNGTWNIDTNYGTCSITPRLITRVYFHIACLAFSFAASLPAIFIFFYYKKLRVTRVALHRNLLIAIVFRNIFVIITRSEILLDELTSATGDTSMARNNWPCKMLAILEKLASNATFVCMLTDGIYLHRLIAAVFKKEPNIKLIHSVGACIAIIPVIIWSSLMATMNDANCWVVYEISGIQWVLDAPRILILVINTILLADILRVLLTKLRRQGNANQLSTTKATLFLMPLFGVQFLLTAWRPTTVSCPLEQTYYMFTYAMEGLQGFMVAVLYCYANKEVQSLIKNDYVKIVQRMGARKTTKNNNADILSSELNVLKNQIRQLEERIDKLETQRGTENHIESVNTEAIDKLGSWYSDKHENHYKFVKEEPLKKVSKTEAYRNSFADSGIISMDDYRLSKSEIQRESINDPDEARKYSKSAKSQKQLYIVHEIKNDRNEENVLEIEQNMNDAEA